MPIRVLHVLKKFRPDFTGMGILLERLTPVMDAIDPNVEHDVLATVTEAPAVVTASSTGLRRTWYLAKVGMSRPHSHIKLCTWMLLHVHRYQIIHFHTHVDRHFVTYVLVKLLGRRMIISATLDDSVPGLLGTYRPILRPIVRRLFSMFDAFVALSPKLQNENETIVGSSSHLIPMGISIPDEPHAVARNEARLKNGFRPEDIVLIFVGGICERKDPLSLIRALVELRKSCPTIKLLLVGPVLEHDYYERIRADIAMHRLDEHVFFSGEVRDPYPLYAIADIMTFPSRLEGFGTVAIEGMAHGLPVVARHLPGVNDYFIRTGATGFLFESEDELIAIVRRLIDEPAVRREVGTAARDYAITHFSMPLVAEKYLRLYRSAEMARAAASKQ